MMDNLMARCFERRGKCIDSDAAPIREGEISRPNSPAITIVARDSIRPNGREVKAEKPSKEVSGLIRLTLI